MAIADATNGKRLGRDDEDDGEDDREDDNNETTALEFVVTSEAARGTGLSADTATSSNRIWRR